MFIADLHLDPEDAETQALALRFIQFAKGYQQLFILGDLFEYWLGDDAGISLYAEFIKALNTLAQSGCTICVMHGNRDFLLGDEFAQAAGATLIRDDECTIELGDLSVLLMHGDTLCTDDKDYQHFRSKVREPQWQAQFLTKPLEARVEQAEALRAASVDASAAKSSGIMDVNAQTVSARLLANGCQTLIHGHTHRPASHTLRAPNGARWVVGDWHPDNAQYVQWDGAKLSLHTFT